MTTKQWTASFLMLVGTLLTTGCEPSLPETALVEGTVIYQGKPVEDARVVFYPSKGRSAGGSTDAEGKFTLMTFEEADGVILGECKVTISKRIGTGPTPENPMGTTTYFLPQRYSQAKTSGLIRTVEPGKNHFDFELTD